MRWTRGQWVSPSTRFNTRFLVCTTSQHPNYNKCGGYNKICRTISFVFDINENSVDFLDNSVVCTTSQHPNYNKYGGYNKIWRTISFVFDFNDNSVDFLDNSIVCTTSQHVSYFNDNVFISLINCFLYKYKKRKVI